MVVFFILLVVFDAYFVFMIRKERMLIGTREKTKYLDTITQFRDSHLPPPPVSNERAAVPPPDAETRKKIGNTMSRFSTSPRARSRAWGTGEEPMTLWTNTFG